MILPNEYVEQMKKRMGDDADVWFAEAAHHLQVLIEKWQLTDLKVLDLSYNIIYSGFAKNHGDIILKLCSPGKEFDTERQALKELNNNLMVKTIDVDVEHRGILLELLKPGNSLWTEAYDNRLNIAAPILAETGQKHYEGDYPHHKDWLQKVKTYVDKHYPEHEISEHLDFAWNNYNRLYQSGNDEMLLHGDLHHGNILKGDQWKVIDPKGVIGCSTLEVGRYMNNQIGEAVELDSCIDEMISSFSKAFDCNAQLIVLSFYMDMVLSTSWFFEDHEVDYKTINDKMVVINKLRKRL